MTTALILHPPVDVRIHPEKLRAFCQTLGLSGDLIEEAEPRSFAAGEHYLDLMTFVGCSPNIHLIPGEAALTKLCYIHFPEPFAEPTLCFGQAIQMPRCPHCKEKITVWKNALGEWTQHPTRLWRCKQCNHSSAIHALQWGYTAGVVSVRLELRGIYPFEGIPAEHLLNSLDREFETHWQYFYC